MAQLVESEIVGIMSESGQAWTASAADGPYTLVFRLLAWKPSNRRLLESTITIRKPDSDPRTDATLADIRAYDVVRLRVLLPDESPPWPSEATLVSLVGKDESDTELNDRARALQLPVTFTDPELGLFTLDREMECYDATSDWCGIAVKLTVISSGDAGLEGALATARQLWHDQAGWNERITAYAAKGLLGLKNSRWLGDDEPEVSLEDFARQISLETISVKSDGSFEFWHNDGELFWGHSIMVSGTIAAGPTNAGIHG